MGPVPVKRASIYKLPSRFIVCPVSTTASGIGLTSEPYIVLSTTVSAVELSQAINQALDNSRDGVNHPISWKGLAAPRLAAAGVKSEATFQKQASLVSLITDGKTVTFTPHRNGGANGNEKGFSPIDECAVGIDPKTQEVCGETVIQVFERCT
jgi:hypothetical protein